MKKLVVLLSVLSVLTLNVSATKYTVTISGLAYSPVLLSAHIGDTVTINGSVSHPLLQVSKATWVANGTTALAGGFGPVTKNVTFTISSADTIYYICVDHVQYGMKGSIAVAKLSGIPETPVEAFSVSLFPNPVSSTATVKLTATGNNPVKISVYSINGQLEKDLTPELTILNGDYYCQFDATRLASGNHFIMATDGTKRTVKKFEIIR